MKHLLERKKLGLILLLSISVLVAGVCYIAAHMDDNNVSEVTDLSESKNEITSQKDSAADNLASKQAEKAQSSDKKSVAAQSEKSQGKTQTGVKTKNKVWVEPVYKTVNHPAVTKEVKVLTGVTCACGAYFSNSGNNATGAWQAHRPVPCDGKHTYYTPHYEIQTVTVTEAWTEKVLVKEGYWKEN